MFEHYRCQKIRMKDTHGTRILGAVWFKHKYLTNTSVTPEDRIIAAIGDDLSLARPDPWGTEDRPQSQAPLSYSIAAPSAHN